MRNIVLIFIAIALYLILKKRTMTEDNAKKDTPLSGLEQALSQTVFDKDLQKFIEDEKANNRMFTKT